MRILILNCGSSSVKYQFIDSLTEQVMAEGIAEKIGEAVSLFTYKTRSFQKKKQQMPIPDHEKAIALIIDELVNNQHGVIRDMAEIEAVGHRLVHAGEYYSDSVVINDHVIAVMEECSSLAPLHNPPNLKGIYALRHLLPQAPQCGVFDTAFHQTMPPRAYLYALPLEFYTRYRIRRYGFHGTSHRYVSEMASSYLQKPIGELKIVSCHIGNGASVTAISGGKSIDTSMGFTPLEGLVMGTRCGDIDPAIPVHLQKVLGMSVDEVNTVLNKQSGMLGLSGISNDMREIEEQILDHKSPAAMQALNVYAYRIRKYIGAYTAAMNGLDVLIFTGGAGENMPILRTETCRDLDCLGIILDEKKNHQSADGILELNTAASRVKILKIPTNEELMIARETEKLLKNRSQK